MNWIAGLVAGVVVYLADWVLWSKVFTTGMDAYVTQMSPEEMEKFMGQALAKSAVLSLAFGFLFVGTGISRLIHARGLKALGKRDEPVLLVPGQADYIKPRGSIYQTDDLHAQPLSITERTTTHLEMDGGQLNDDFVRKAPLRKK